MWHALHSLEDNTVKTLARQSTACRRSRVSDGLKGGSGTGSSIQVAYKETTVSLTATKTDSRKYIKIFIGIFVRPVETCIALLDHHYIIAAPMSGARSGLWRSDLASACIAKSFP